MPKNVNLFQDGSVNIKKATTQWLFRYLRFAFYFVAEDKSASLLSSRLSSPTIAGFKILT